MSRIIKLAAVAAAAAAAITASSSVASASTPFTATLASGTTLDVSIGGSVVASCTTATLSGSFSTANDFQVTSANINGCGVSVTPQNLPWTGTIDNSGNITITGFRVSALVCTYGSASNTLTGTGGGGLPFSTTLSGSIDRVSGVSWLCPTPAGVTASYNFS